MSGSYWQSSAPQYSFEQLTQLLKQYRADQDPERASLKKLAETLALPEYNLGAEQARHKQQEGDLALSRQLAALEGSTQERLGAAAANTTAALSAAQKQAQRRGMQRSSYNEAAQGMISAQGIQAQEGIQKDRQVKQSELQAQRDLLARQLSETLARLEGDYSSSAASKQRDLEEDKRKAQEEQNQITQWILSFLSKQR